MTQPMTLDDLAAVDRDDLTCTQAATVLRVSQYNLHEAAIDRPESLGFPVVVIGRRVRIPKIPFLRHMGWEG